MSPVGIGYDTHRLVRGRRLILGGVEIPGELGLEGHSDADVLTHAVIDALLGAAGLGDIGEHFPDTDERYRDADSLCLLADVLAALAAGRHGCRQRGLHDRDGDAEARSVQAGDPYVPEWRSGSATGARQRQGEHRRGDWVRRPR